MLEDVGVSVFSMNDFSDLPDIEEDGETFFENAMKKAHTIAHITGEMVLADDSGLEVDYLKGKPGVRSSRYSGKNATDEQNIQKLLLQLQGVPEDQRGASFRCILVLYRPDGWFNTFEGRLRGQISKEPLGDGGFGYDPVFFVSERGMTVSQLSITEKNQISHRALAVGKLKEWLKKGNASEKDV